jgi:hypothetical protein
MANDTIEIKLNNLVFSVLLLRSTSNDFFMYVIIKYCRRRHAVLLTENRINLLCIGIKYLSIRSFTFTTEMSINMVITKPIIKTIKNLLLNGLPYWLSKAQLLILGPLT